MTNNLESDVKYVPYNEVIKKSVLDYYYANKETISQKRKDKYKQLSPEDKKNLEEHSKKWPNLNVFSLKNLIVTLGGGTPAYRTTEGSI